jgi:hypothetical protein
VRAKRRRNANRRRTRKLLLAEIAIGILVCTGVFAYTSGLTVAATNAGDGSGSVGSTTVATLVYELDATNPTFISDVKLTFSGGVPGVVKAMLGASGWTTCTNSAGTWTCAWSGASEPAFPGNNTTNLRVVAAS